MPSVQFNYHEVSNISMGLSTTCHFILIYLWEFVVDIIVRMYCSNTPVVAVSNLVRNMPFSFYTFLGATCGGVSLADWVTCDYDNNYFQYVLCRLQIIDKYSVDFTKWRESAYRPCI